MTGRNPFAYETANNLSDEMVADYFIDDYNYSRFLASRRNIFLVGERGSGKTMALLYNRHRIQRLIATRENETASLEFIGIYVPCNTHLTYKPEFDLLNGFLSSVLSEHLFVLSIAHSIVTDLSDLPDLLEGADENRLRAEASAVVAVDLPADFPFFDSIRVFLETQIRDTQRTALSRELDAFHEDTFSFASLVMPLLSLLKRGIPALRDSHYNLLIDDAQALNDAQHRALNSWIAFRDHSLFSFKIATTKVALGTRKTASGSSILEGHDYTTIDLEKPLHNRRTGFYHLAKEIIKKRLTEVGIDASPDQFFPVNEQMQKDLEDAKFAVRKIAIEKFGGKNKKAVADYVYKNARAHYFRSRSPKANLPPYSGFDTLVYISTGVVRNLLEPCYWMFDRAVSDMHSDDGDTAPFAISPSIQTEVILERSALTWERLRNRLPNDIEDCSIKQGKQAFQLVDALATHFRQRLLGTGAERGGISFTVSRQKSSAVEDLMPLLRILQSAQMLYVRSGPAKDRGRREPYYVPNRILWPDRGLDPNGQYARVSLTSDALWEAAQTGRLPNPRTRKGDSGGMTNGQPELWADD